MFPGGVSALSARLCTRSVAEPMLNVEFSRDIRSLAHLVVSSSGDTPFCFWVGGVDFRFIHQVQDSKRDTDDFSTYTFLLEMKALVHRKP
jgi:hypothetical protein